MAVPGQPGEEEVEDRAEVEDDDVPESIRYVISSYGADYPVDGLVKRIKRGDVYVPEFQRGYVWSVGQGSRFIESLLLGLPVPGIFLFKEPDTQKLVVVDGQQRLRTLQYFYDGVLRGKEFALHGVSGELENLTYSKMGEEDRRRLDDAVLHATIFQQEDPKDDRSSIYLIFERLNTGGTPLAPQEIRSSVYRGPFNDLLKNLANHPKWREIYGPSSLRAKDQELILRVLALYCDAKRYARPMKGFLNAFMDRNRAAPDDFLKPLARVFEKTATLAADALGRAVFRPERNLNAAVVDAFFVGLAHRLENGAVQDKAALKVAAQKVLADADFRASVTSGTTGNTAVERRLQLATDAFAGVK